MALIGFEGRIKLGVEKVYIVEVFCGEWNECFESAARKKLFNIYDYVQRKLVQ